jgi:anti-sigma B factor antagonist
MSVFEISQLDGGAGLRLSGELDLASAPRLKEALLFDVGHVAELTLDLTEVTFLDSSGWSAILECARSRNGDGRLVLVNPSNGVARALELMGLDEHPSIEVQHRE